MQSANNNQSAYSEGSTQFGPAVSEKTLFSLCKLYAKKRPADLPNGRVWQPVGPFAAISFSNITSDRRVELHTASQDWVRSVAINLLLALVRVFDKSEDVQKVCRAELQRRGYRRQANVLNGKSLFLSNHGRWPLASELGGAYLSPAKRLVKEAAARRAAKLAEVA